ncbi:hypothetical protein VTN77DRAFT_2773 [Rasamsonia byssochlamydoides]|uniref:uncharacterized protein n=1 Tax=Rasamsonia byssochlamydoides TaxID=89139 RepID=UPI0037431835
MEVFHTPPVASSFTPLAEHQSRTPESFYDGPPVLHYHSDRCKVVILESDLTAAPALNALRGPAVTNGNAVNGSATAQEAGGETTQEKEVVIDDVDVWVTSDKFLLFRTAAKSGVAIPYPSISLHAIQRLRLPDVPGGDEVQGLYMQIANPSAEGLSEEDEEEDSVTLTIIPPPVTEAASAALGSYTAGTETTALTAADMAAEDGAENKPETATQALFAAVSACSNLHPDPISHGEEDDEDYGMDEQGGVGSLLRSGIVAPGSNDGGLPPPVDGSSGWITAENMHEYFDEEGNWIGEGEPPSMPLGPGAGTVRPREEEGEGDGTDGHGEETKWRRTG